MCRMTQNVPDERDHLPQEQLALVRASHQLILSKSEHVAGVLHLPATEVEHGLQDLQAKGRLAFGLQDRSQIWSPPHRYVTARGLKDLGIEGPTWHEEANRSVFLPRFPLINPFYAVTASLTPRLGEFQRLEWLTDAGLDAVPVFDKGWIGLMWSGTFESDFHLQRRLESLPQRLNGLATTPERPWPSTVVLVAEDSWQKEQAAQVAKRLFLPPGFLQIWCPDEGAWPGIDHLSPSRGDISQPVFRRDLGAWTWERRLEQAIYALPGNAIQIMLLIAEWRELSAPWIKAARHESEQGRTTQRALTALRKARLIGRRGSKRHYVYYPTARALEQLRLRDGIGARLSKEDADRERERLRRHETGLKDLVLPFIIAGNRTACGIRSWEDMGKEGGGIKPDAMILLLDTPFGPGWVYVEYELTAQSPDQVRGKLLGYGSDLRRDDFPVLVVCANDLAEANFRSAGRDLGIRMLTTTVARLRQHGPLGNRECWSRYGEMVQIG